MTVKIRSAFTRIIPLFIAAAMIVGLIYTVVSTGSYDAVHGMGGYRNEMSAPGLPATSDLIADSSAQVDLTRFLTGRDRSGRQFDGPSYIGRTDFKSCDIFSVNLCIFLLYVLFGTSIFSFKHIFFIHLKDGNK